MPYNLYTKPIVKTGETVETDEYTQDLTVEEDGVVQKIVHFPQCLSEFTEEQRKQIITDIMVKSLTKNN